MTKRWLVAARVAALAAALLAGQGQAGAQAQNAAPAAPTPAVPAPVPPQPDVPAATDVPPPPPPAPKAETQAKSDAPFGVEVTLTPKTIVSIKGNATWDKALDSLQDAFKSVYALLEKQGIAKAGASMTIYTQTDDTGFSFQAAVPVADDAKDKLKDVAKGDIEVGQSPGGKALKFVHRGSYDSMDNTYDAITGYLDEKRLEAADVFVEEYETDPVTTPDDKFVVTVYVPLK